WAVETHSLGLQNSALQLRLIETERLVTLGGIAGAVVHDLVQPLSHMTYNANFLAEHAAVLEELRRIIKAKGDKLGHSDREKLLEFFNDLPEIVADMREGCAFITETVTRLRHYMGKARVDNGVAEADPLAVIRYAIRVCRNIAHQNGGDFL